MCRDELKTRVFLRSLKQHNRELVDCGLLYGATFLRESLLELIKSERLTRKKKF